MLQEKQLLMFHQLIWKAYKQTLTILFSVASNRKIVQNISMLLHNNVILFPNSINTVVNWPTEESLRLDYISIAKEKKFEIEWRNSLKNLLKNKYLELETRSTASTAD